MEKNIEEVIEFLGILDIGFRFLSKKGSTSNKGSITKYYHENTSGSTILIVFNEDEPDVVQVEMGCLLVYDKLSNIHLPLEGNMLEMNHVVKQALAYKLVEYECPGANKMLREYKINNLFAD